MIPAARKPGNPFMFKVTLQELWRRVAAHFPFPFFTLRVSLTSTRLPMSTCFVSQEVKTGPAPRARTESEPYGSSTPQQAGNCRMKYVTKVLSHSCLTAKTAQFCSSAAVAAAASLQTVSAWMLQFDRNRFLTEGKSSESNEDTEGFCSDWPRISSQC